jgi:hypothetical protein
MTDNQTGFTFLKWNGEYGSKARFVVRDNSNNKQSFFTPGDMKDVAWAANDLTQTPEAKGWDGFQDETVDNLADVVF